MCLPCLDQEGEVQTFFPLALYNYFNIRKYAVFEVHVHLETSL